MGWHWENTTEVSITEVEHIAIDAIKNEVQREKKNEKKWAEIQWPMGQNQWSNILNIYSIYKWSPKRAGKKKQIIYLKK